jgi:hypothetical protein
MATMTNRRETIPMRDEKPKQRSAADEALQQEVLEGRKFTLEEAIARMAGPGAMKGESPVTRMQQAEVEIEIWLTAHLADAGGALKPVLHRQVKSSELLLSGFEQPLAVLAAYCHRLLDSEYLLEELVRDADVEWGRVMGERPYLQCAGAPQHPDDPYTVDSVRKKLGDLIDQLAAAEEKNS